MIGILVSGWVGLLVVRRAGRPALAHRFAAVAVRPRRSMPERLGRSIQARVPQVGSLRAGVVGVVALTAVVLVLIDPLVAVVVVAATGVAGFAARLAARRARRARLLDELPVTLEVLRMAIGSGLTFAAALDLVAEDLGGEIGACFAWVQARRDRGERLADALDALGDREGEPLDGVLAMLVVAQRSGAPIADALERAAAHQRAELRRAAQTRVRRLPVTMLLPLMACVMPSFVLLTIVPLLAGGISEVRFP